jgi:uncharacterized protein (TIGR02145 family)
LCNGVSYDPSIYRCEWGQVIGKCKDKDYFPAYEQCVGGVVVGTNNNQSSSSLVNHLSSSSSSNYQQQQNSSSSIVSSSSEPCTAANNTETHYCSNGTMKIYGSTPSVGGRTYKTVEIGDQTWMAENLNYDVAGAKCYGEGGKALDRNSSNYIILSEDEVQSNCDTYGRLYDWATAMGLPADCNFQSCPSIDYIGYTDICPSGWHLPSDLEWSLLIMYVEYAHGCETSIYHNCAAKHLIKYNIGLDTYGFAALNGGLGLHASLEESLGSFGDVNYGNWWSRSRCGSGIGGAYWRAIYVAGISPHFLPYGNEYCTAKSQLMSIRCLKDN